MSAPACDLCGTAMQPTEAVAVLASIMGRDRPTSEQADAFPWCCPDCRLLRTEDEPGALGLPSRREYREQADRLLRLARDPMQRRADEIYEADKASDVNLRRTEREGS